MLQRSRKGRADDVVRDFAVRKRFIADAEVFLRVMRARHTLGCRRSSRVRHDGAGLGKLTSLFAHQRSYSSCAAAARRALQPEPDRSTRLHNAQTGWRQDAPSPSVNANLAETPLSPGFAESRALVGRKAVWFSMNPLLPFRSVTRTSKTAQYAEYVACGQALSPSCGIARFPLAHPFFSEVHSRSDDLCDGAIVER